MKLGTLPFAVHPFSSSGGVDASAASSFADLLANPDLPRVYLMLATPWDPDAEAEVTVRASAGAIWPVYDGEHWPARLLTTYHFQSRLFLENSANIFGVRNQVGFGDVRVAIGAGDLDAWLSYFWAGRSLTLLVGGDDFEFDEFHPVFSGSIRDVLWTDDELTLSLQDPTERLRVPVQSTVYAGDDAAFEGDENLAETPKPLAVGNIDHIEPVLVNRTHQIYQYHDGAVDLVVGAFDRAATLTDAGDVTIDDGDPGATQPSAGEYVTDIGQGLLQLGVEPDGPLTVKVLGLQSAFSGGTRYRVSDIARHLVTRAVLTEDELDLPAFNALSTQAPAPIGYYLRDELTLEVLLDELMATIGGYWGWTSTGQLTVGQLTLPAPAESVETLDETVLTSFERLPSPLPVWRFRIGYHPCWRVHTPAEVASGAGAGIKNFVVAAHRTTTSYSPDIQTAHPLARDIARDTLHVGLTYAIDEALREIIALRDSLGLFRAVMYRRVHRYQLGQVVTIIHRGPFASPGRPMRILGLIEDADEDRVELELWG